MGLNRAIPLLQNVPDQDQDFRRQGHEGVLQYLQLLLNELKFREQTFLGSLMISL